jgi:hypothetical protein
MGLTFSMHGINKTSALYLFKKYEGKILFGGPWCRWYVLTFQSQAVSLRTTRFNIQKFYMMLALR